MCVICVLYKQEKLTRKEAIKAGMEQIRTENLSDKEIHHIFDEVVGKLINEEAAEHKQKEKENERS